MIHPPPELDLQPISRRPSYITSLAFSSESGGKAILAVGRVDGRLMLWSPLDSEPRLMPLNMPHSAGHISFRPLTIRCKSQRHPSVMADNEMLLVGDELGHVWAFLIEWPCETDRFLFGWEGAIVPHARISVHAQQICGIAWSPDGEQFATGGNDNLCCLFRTSCIFPPQPRQSSATLPLQRDARGRPLLRAVQQREALGLIIGPQDIRQSWKLTAAVKAIAFCPWQKGLLAAGGGSNDRCIHVYHTMSGATLATIDCAAQVTSVVWSNTKREVAATLGFPQPEHPYRIVVFAWPSCAQIIAIPWQEDTRALYSIAYPGGPCSTRRPSQERGAWWSRPGGYGSLIVAGSDGSIKFHEIWSDDGRGKGAHSGLLGGSDILESLHGIDKEGRETIR